MMPDLYECPRCDVQWAASAGRNCWWCGEPGVEWRWWYGWHCPGDPAATPWDVGLAEMQPGRPFGSLPPAPGRLVPAAEGTR